MGQVLKICRCIAIFLLVASSLESEEISVTNLTDLLINGSLRNALTIAQENDVIVFNGALSGTVLLLSPLPAINANIKIIGPPSGLVIVSGNALQPAFQINGGNVEFTDLNITAAATLGSGSGLFIGDFAEVAFTRGSFTACVAAGSEGGAVHVGQGAVFTAVDTTFSLNISGGDGDDVFLDSGGRFNYSCSSTIPAMNVFGEGQIVKTGSGTATFTVPASTPLSLIVREGEVIASGIRTEPTLVLGTSRVEGSQTTLYIANHGIVKPSTSIGTIICTDDYYQSPSATLEIAITPGTADLLQVGGNAFLHGTLAIFPEAGTYTIGTTYTILTTTGVINPGFVTLTASSMAFDVHYFPQRVDIEIIGL